MTDFSKPLQTRDGSIKWDEEGKAYKRTRRGDPYYRDESDFNGRGMDLVNAPEPRVYYFGIDWEGKPWAVEYDPKLPRQYRITIAGDKCEIEAIK